MLLLAVIVAQQAAAIPYSPPLQTFKWDLRPDLYPAVDITIPRTRHLRMRVKRAGSKQVVVTQELHKGGTTSSAWRIKLSLPSSSNGAAAVATSDRVYVATYSRTATGCRLSAIDSKSGRLVWTVPLQGLGSVAHSRYYNRVQLRIQNNQPVVYGHEGPGNGYIEMRRYGDGALIKNTRHTVNVPREHLGEHIYNEAKTLLGKKKRVTINSKDFARRHGLSFANANARKRAFRQAAKAVANSPLKGRYRLRLDVVGGGKSLVARKII